MTDIDMQRLLATVDAIEPALRNDPLFEDATVEQLRAYLSASSADPARLFGAVLQGMTEAYRYGAVRCLGALYGKAETADFGGELAAGEIRFIRGSAKLDGNLRIPENAIVVVTGDLFVSGNVVEDGADYAMIGIGAQLRAANVLVSGEVLCAEAIVRFDYITYGNDYAGRIGRLQAARYISDDHFDRIVSEQIGQKIVGHPLPDAGAVFPANLLENEDEPGGPRLVRWKALAKTLLASTPE